MKKTFEEIKKKSFENLEGLKNLIEEKVENLEVGETEVLFLGKYPFLILYKSIKFIEIELLKDFSFYTDFNFDGIIEAICEANEEVRFQYRNKFQCYNKYKESPHFSGGDEFAKKFKNLLKNFSLFYIFNNQKIKF